MGGDDGLGNRLGGRPRWSVCSLARESPSVPCNIPGPSPWALARPPAGW